MSDRRKNAPSFSGNSMPMNINLVGMDDGAEETTRRVAFQPSFEPMSSFEPPSLKESHSIRAPKPSFQPDVGASKGTWRLQGVPVLPKFHRVEETAVFVPHTSPKEVSMRVSDVLRERSIQATFDDEKAKVSCFTSDGVDFRVRLYRGRDEFSHGIIVEVQRRFGTSFSFYDDTKAILSAAEGKVPPPPSGKFLPMVVDESAPARPAHGPEPSSSLSMVSEMLNQPGQDTTFLGLQILSSLTDSTKMNAGTAKAISAEMLRLDDSNEVAGNLFSLLMDADGDKGVYNVRTLAFQAVANAFHSVNGNVSNLMKEQLASLVVDALLQADKSPHVAYHAARMAFFFTSSELRSPLQKALEVGKVRHAGLEHQARICLENMA